MTLRRFGALLVTTALTAAFVAALAVPVTAAKDTYTCFGKEATITGTPGVDTLVGTPGADVIVGRAGNDRIFGRGGNDLICGGLGKDLLAGNAGNDKIAGNGAGDRMFGGVGNDRMFAGIGPDLVIGGHGNDVIHGGQGTDFCKQGAGLGIVVHCELPPKPKAKPVPKNLAVAYADVVRDDKYGAGDRLIAKLVDTNLDGVPSKGDSIVMDQYPTHFDPSKPWAKWGTTSHVVKYVKVADTREINVMTNEGNILWINDPTEYEIFEEVSDAVNGASPANSDTLSRIQDYLLFDDSLQDEIIVYFGSPSQPTAEVWTNHNLYGDTHHTVDVDINAKVTY